jgi:hypothetical protein
MSVLRSGRTLDVIASVANIPALVFLAWGIAYLWSYTATYAVIWIVVMAVAFVGLLASIALMRIDVTAPLIVLDALGIVVLGVVGELVMLNLDPLRPVGLAILLVPIVLGGCSAVGMLAAMAHRRIWSVRL